MHECENPGDFYDNVIMPYKGKLEEWYVENNGIVTYFSCIWGTIWTLFTPGSAIAWKLFKGPLEQLPCNRGSRSKQSPYGTPDAGKISDYSIVFDIPFLEFTFIRHDYVVVKIPRVLTFVHKFLLIAKNNGTHTRQSWSYLGNCLLRN